MANEELKGRLRESLGAYAPSAALWRHCDAARARAPELKKALDPGLWGTLKYFRLMLLCKYFQKMGQEW